MRQILKLLCGLILLSVTGCDIENIDKSPREEADAWLKPGADSTEVGKALLECGMPSLINLDSANKNRSLNQIATIYACMVQAGFRKKSGGPYWCYNYKDLPICQPGAIIPQRSVEKRLNSPFCKRSPVQPECKP
ncbi:hypothetical protein ME7_01438 [Bartonella birtlesii LL-WM9]|uniref:Phage protein n=1 Tax=Bartonella birtlesii LL-WM9 TaxID=1094552 RepID=J0PPN6_9HYPH|nr:hypothetical protein [Bartonella birtlesii]EJF74406.1 hypothetical protein ME7_01438 [Bartonella birtlesii LL-WM9]